jgi:hypothetical protein
MASAFMAGVRFIIARAVINYIIKPVIVNIKKNSTFPIARAT